MLRPPSADDQGVILNCVRPDTPTEDSEPVLADPNDWQVTAYREQFFSLDPFVNLPPNQVAALEDIVPDKELIETDYYLHYLKPINLFRILGIDTQEPGGTVARLRFSRRRAEPRFRDLERELLGRLLPHLRRALEIYARLNRAITERDIYAGAVNQLSVASIILDESGRFLSSNDIGHALLEQGNGLSVVDGRLLTDGRDLNQELQQAVNAVIKADQQGDPTLVRALRIPRKAGRADLGLVVRPVPSNHLGEGPATPRVAIFISDPELEQSTSGQVLGELFDLTPAESNLARLLARGLSLAEVSVAQNVSQHTARAQLKSIFAKTGVSRQAELVRLVLKSVASLG